MSSHFPAGKPEIRLLIAITLTAVLLADFVIYGGLNLGFAITGIACIVLSNFYLCTNGSKLTGYNIALIVLDLIIAGSFVRSDDGFVKFVMVCFLLISGNLSLTLMTGQNRRSPNGITSLLDAPRALFSLGLGQMPNALGGLNDARKNAGSGGKKSMAVLAGLAVAVPVLAILIPLLMRADAAFEGLMDLLPEMDISEPILALLFGLPLACVLYARNAALKHKAKEAPSPWTPRQFNSLTINTVLFAVCGVYLVYLFSQLAYFIGGFAGILPEEYTMAEYARRGFFEMAWLSAINLVIMTLAVALSERKEGRTPLLTRLLCQFIGVVTLFFTVAASSKMFLYIGSYGLTRLRLLTEVIMVFIALTVLFVTLWLFKPKFAYMKAVLLSALIIGACVAWADVDTVVAAYNVNAYQSGQLETVDMTHLCALGDGAVPYIQELTNDSDPQIANRAQRHLQNRAGSIFEDLRGYNIASGTAETILEDYRIDDTSPEEAADIDR